MCCTCCTTSCSLRPSKSKLRAKVCVLSGNRKKEDLMCISVISESSLSTPGFSFPIPAVVVLVDAANCSGYHVCWAVYQLPVLTKLNKSVGVQALDTLTPLGRGQAQLLVGPATSGKTSLAVDAIIGQHALQQPGQPPVRCVYASVGHRSATSPSVSSNAPPPPPPL